MSYFGGYLGSGSSGSSSSSEEEEGELALIPAPIEYGDPVYHNIVQTAVDRLPQQFRFSE